MGTDQVLRDQNLARTIRLWMDRRIGRREAVRRLLLLGVSLPTASALLEACRPSTPSTPQQAAPKTKAIIGITQEPTSLDPTADATNAIAVCLRDNVYEGLVRLDASGTIVGSLASSWDVSSDGTNWTFHLMSGARWHDGSPFSAQDVKFAWERAMDPASTPPNPHQEYWDPVSSVDVLDDTTVKVTLKTFSDNWLFHMAAGSAAIVSPTSASTNVTQPVGTGPFAFGAWNRGASLRLVRNERYWGTLAKLREVEFRFIPDANAMNNALQAGDIDAIGQVGGPEQLGAFEQDPRFTVTKGSPVGKVMVAVNNTSGALADARVRQALYAAIDRQAWITGYALYAAPIGSHAAPNGGEPYFVDLTAANPYDPSNARQLLEAAGQTNLTLRLAQIPYPYAVRCTDILASQLRAIGVQLRVEPMEFPRWLQQVFSNAQDYDLTIINHTEERDIANYANPNYYWHVTNPQLATWLKQADAEPDEARRKSVYARVQQQLADDAVNLWVYSPNQLAVSTRAFEGYQVPGIAPSLYLGNAGFS